MATPAAAALPSSADPNSIGAPAPSSVSSSSDPASSSSDPQSSSTDTPSDTSSSSTVTSTSTASTPSSSSSDSSIDTSSSDTRSTVTTTTISSTPSPTSSSTTSTGTKSLTESTDISSLTDTDSETTKDTSSDTSSSIPSTTTKADDTKTKTPASSTPDASSSTKHSSTTDVIPTMSASPTPAPDSGKLGTGTIIGISLAGFAVIGILLVVLGTCLKYRRKRIIEKQTAHLKRASQLWEFADSNSNMSAVDRANEKAASERGGSDPTPFNAPRNHSRKESNDSGAGSEVGSEHSYGSRPPAASQNPYHQNMMMAARPPPPPMLGYMHPMQRIVNRLSSIPFMGATRPAPPPPPMPPLNHLEYGLPMPPPLNREDSFGARAHQAPRNAFFPPPPPKDLPVAPMVLPGSGSL